MPDISNLLVLNSLDQSRWAMMLPAAIQVCPIELPGRGRRQDEPAIDDIAALADILTDALPLQVLVSRLKRAIPYVKRYQCLSCTTNA